MSETPTLGKILAKFTRQRIETETALARLSDEDRVFLKAEEVLFKHLCPAPSAPVPADKREIEIPGIEAAIKAIEAAHAAPDFTKASVVMRACGYEGLPGGRAAITQAEKREKQ